ncbi:hypothetical protein SAMN03159496_05276 [Rhizobium sp. NFR07]|uniref:hypothetical protein n=1 Tax=Rhizobium sp. NFR07 TaxID=1566262 RepID=UPI0008E13973|nr:hypothetical protein [Rhizobium sp. NFR07]SFB57263.1 hypothetical protein SAMN03159496_05276 [Rhizobium sp. NFR07]
MQTISDWLDDRVQEIIGPPGIHDRKADFQEQAKLLWLQAEVAGFTVAQLKEACGGDVEQYLLEQQNAMTDVGRQRALEEVFDPAQPRSS